VVAPDLEAARSLIATGAVVEAAELIVGPLQ